MPVVSKDEFGGTGFTAAHLGNSPLHGYKVPSSLPVEVGRLLRAGEPFVYAYYDGIDKVAHGSGLGDHYDAELRAVDRLVADLVDDCPRVPCWWSPPTTARSTSAPGSSCSGASSWPRCAFISGEGRFRWLHARPGAAADLVPPATERYGDTTWVIERDQLIDEGWFGGPLGDDHLPTAWATWP